MRIEQTTDLDLACELLTHPGLYRRMAGDFSPPIELVRPFMPTPPAGTRLLLAIGDDGEAHGLFVLVERNPILCEVHMCLHHSPDESAAAFLQWLWKSTGYRRAVGYIPGWNTRAIAFAERWGFSRFAANPQCVMRGGRLYDEVWVGIPKPLGEQHA